MSLTTTMCCFFFCHCKNKHLNNIILLEISLPQHGVGAGSNLYRSQEEEDDKLLIP